MIALIQRVTMARVQVAGRTTGEIGAGLLALIGVERHDREAQGARLLERMLDYRVFADAAGRMNRSLRDTAGGLLLVPQFTLVADTSSGNRPGFSGAAVPEQARALFGQLLDAARAAHAPVAAGEFGAHMELTLTNDGPVTFWLSVPPAAAAPEA
jgi:D-tyrosyl-tRNA(Tyr) deacylase